MTRFRPILILLTFATAAIPFTVAAKTVSNSMDARVRVDTSCRMTVEPMRFGNANIFSGAIDTTALIHLRCGPAVAYTVAMDNGQNFNGERRMASGTGGFFGYVRYEIYRNAARSQVWGSAAGNTVSGITPANGDVTLTAYGRVPGGIIIPRAYSDVVTVTVNF